MTKKSIVCTKTLDNHLPRDMSGTFTMYVKIREWKGVVVSTVFNESHSGGVRRTNCCIAEHSQAINR